MMSLNYLAVSAAAVAGMATGALWFSRVLLGRAWARNAGVELGRKVPAGVYALAFVATAVTAVVLAAASGFVHLAVGGPFLTVAVVTAVVGWLGFTVARCAVEYLFEQRPVALFAIDMGHQLAVVAVMATVIGLFGN